ncbi:MAG: hypothetical protein RLZZ216_2586 [Cyanobacteriota bacterium]|jgi:predicted RNase H-like HicB family nuclease
MTPTFTAVIRQDGPWWLGWVEEVPGVNAQEHTREELLASLRQALREALEFNRLEALEAAGSGYEEHALPLSNDGICCAISTRMAASY